jgi:hypothetical protein
MLKTATLGATALLACTLSAAPLSLHFSPNGSVSLAVDSAGAIIGRPLTPFSIAGVHRRAYRRAYYGYGAYGHYGYGYGYGAYYHPYRHYGYGGYRPYGYGIYGYHPYRSYGIGFYPRRLYGYHPYYRRLYRY